MIKKLLLVIIFVIFTFLISRLIAPYYVENQSEFPYSYNLFSQCVVQKTDSFVTSISNNGGYLAKTDGIANVLTMEQEIESNMPAIFDVCEELLDKEDHFVRETKQLNVVIESDVSIFLDGLWKSESGKVIPAFPIHVAVPLAEASYVAQNVMQDIDETGFVRDAVISAFGKDVNENIIRQSISKSITSLKLANSNYLNYNINFAVAPEQILVNSKTKEISFILNGKVKKEDYEFKFNYHVKLDALEITVACSILNNNPVSLPAGKEVVFDCGFYSCSMPWNEKVFLPKLCSHSIISVDGKVVKNE